MNMPYTDLVAEYTKRAIKQGQRDVLLKLKDVLEEKVNEVNLGDEYTIGYNEAIIELISDINKVLEEL